MNTAAAVAPSAPPYLARIAAAVDADLALRLSRDEPMAPRLFEAMRYATLGAGKRLRPALVAASAEACGGSFERALPAASAVELLHAYTLVHDDLPAMDDDDLRRGQPTVHKAFDEAIAILAGDALLTLAFGALADLQTGVADAIRVLAQRSGADELLAGQAADVSHRFVESLPALERIHSAKTGALFSAAAQLGAISAGADFARQTETARIGLDLGIAFQYRDDADDGEHAHLRAPAAARMAELSQGVLERCAALGAAGANLSALAGWILDTP